MIALYGREMCMCKRREGKAHMIDHGCCDY